MAPLLFSAVTPSIRQLLMLLRCISFSKKAQVRITAEGLRFSCEEGSSMEAFIFLEKSLFTTYNYNTSNHDSHTSTFSEDPLFEISLTSLLETLHIFALSDPTATRRGGDLESSAAHRSSRHAAVDAFSNRALRVSGTCTFSYAGPGSTLSVYMSETGVSTTCDLTAYEAQSREDIPFDRESLALKTIMPSNQLLNAANELLAMTPSEYTIEARPAANEGDQESSELAFKATGTLGSVSIDFTTKDTVGEPVLETFQCPKSTSVRFNVSVLKAAQRAMSTASKVSLRLDRSGVLSMQFLVALGPSSNAADAVAFVDFRAVPLFEMEDGNADSDTSND